MKLFNRGPRAAQHPAISVKEVSPLPLGVKKHFIISLKDAVLSKLPPKGAEKVDPIAIKVAELEPITIPTPTTVEKENINPTAATNNSAIADNSDTTMEGREEEEKVEDGDTNLDASEENTTIADHSDAAATLQQDEPTSANTSAIATWWDNIRTKTAAGKAGLAPGTIKVLLKKPFQRATKSDTESRIKNMSKKVSVAFSNIQAFPKKALSNNKLVSEQVPPVTTIDSTPVASSDEPAAAAMGPRTYLHVLRGDSLIVNALIVEVPEARSQLQRKLHWAKKRSAQAS